MPVRFPDRCQSNGIRRHASRREHLTTRRARALNALGLHESVEQPAAGRGDAVGVAERAGGDVDDSDGVGLPQVRQERLGDLQPAALLRVGKPGHKRLLMHYLRGRRVKGVKTAGETHLDASPDGCIRAQKYGSELFLRKSRPACERPVTRTPHPRSRSIFAVASPVPLVPPMIIPFLPWHRSMCILLARSGLLC